MKVTFLGNARIGNGVSAQCKGHAMSLACVVFRVCVLRRNAFGSCKIRRLIKCDKVPKSRQIISSRKGISVWLLVLHPSCLLHPLHSSARLALV